MSKCVISRELAKANALPLLCMQCGEQATAVITKKFSWTPVWVYALLTLGPDAFLTAVSSTTQRMTIPVPFCDQHQTHFSARNQFAGLGFLALFGALFVIFTFLDDDAVSGYLLIALGVLAVVWCGILFANTKTAIQPTEINATDGTFINVHETFTAALVGSRRRDASDSGPQSWHDDQGPFADPLIGEKASPGSSYVLPAQLFIIGVLTGFIQLFLGSRIYGPDYDLPIAVGTILICVSVTSLVVFVLAWNAGWSFLRLLLAVFIPTLILFLGISQKVFRVQALDRERLIEHNKASVDGFTKTCDECMAVLSGISDKDSPEIASQKIERILSRLGGCVRSVIEVRGSTEQETEKVKREIAHLLEQKAGILKTALADAKGKVKPTDEFIRVVNLFGSIIERMENWVSTK